MGDLMAPRNHRLAERLLIKAVEAGVLEVDTEGRVWRIAVHRGRFRYETPRRRAEKVLPTGYLMVRVMRDGRLVTGLAHRLVWQHLHGDIPAGLVINHKNGQKADNRPSNLELVTYSGNTRHAHRSGLRDQRGQKNPAARVSDHDIAAIRTAYAAGGVTMQALGDRYGIALQTVSKIVRGERRASQLGATSHDDHRRRASSGVRDPLTGRFVPPGTGAEGHT